MYNSTKKKAALTRVILVLDIIVIIASVALWLVFQYAVGSEKIGRPAILVLFCSLFLGFGLTYVVAALIAKRSSMMLGGAPSAVIGITILLILVKVPVLAIVIITIALLLISAVAVYAVHAPRLVVEFDNNPEAGRKTYAEKKAEEAAAPSEPEPEKPELKSFKD